MFDNWQLAGLQVDIDIDGKLNERHEIDRGWRVQLALPWAGLRHVLDGDCPPAAGQHLRVALARNQVMDQNKARQAGVWSWHTAGVDGIYAPQSYPVIELTV